jgi:hypothetical protein
MSVEIASNALHRVVVSAISGVLVVDADTTPDLS